MQTSKEPKIVEGIDDEEEEGDVLEKYQISSYGADYPVDGLVERFKTGSIVIPPFQRGYVWPITKASRFIESLLLGLPVPGIFLYKEDRTNRLVVIDGNQRLTTLKYFYEGVFGPTKREFSLVGIRSEFKGATYGSLPVEDRRTLDNSILHATIVRQDKPSNDLTSVFHIFERLNTGGQPLQAQEIRSAIYSGGLNNLIRTLNANESWRRLYGGVSSRMRDQELILRFFALYYWEEKYKAPMRGFLNRFMYNNRDFESVPEEELTQLFVRTVEMIDKSLGGKAFRQRELLIAAVFDAVMVGIARTLRRGPITNLELLRKKHMELLGNKDFKAVTEFHTSDLDKVRERINIAVEIFSEVG